MLGCSDACLKEYLSDGVTAGQTPDNCNYDPRSEPEWSPSPLVPTSSVSGTQSGSVLEKKASWLGLQTLWQVRPKLLTPLLLPCTLAIDICARLFR